MKKFISALLAGAMMLSLAACGGSGGKSGGGAASNPPAASNPATPPAASQPAEPAGPEPVTIRIGYMANYASLWGVLSAIDQGCFAEENITVVLSVFGDGPSEVAAMEGGSIDMAYIGKGAHRLCIQDRAVIFAPSSVHTTDKIIVSGKSGIEKMEDLKGKKIAYNSGVSTATLNNALKVAGLTDKDVELYDMDVTYMVSAMASGQVDASIAWNPYDAQILQTIEGSKQIEFSDGSVNISSWICLPSYAEKNHDVLVRFTRALLKGMDWGSKEENWEAVAQLCAKQTATDFEANLQQVRDATWFDSETIRSDLKDGTLKGYYEHAQQDFLDTESIKPEEAKDDVGDFILFDVLEEALG